MFYIIYWEFVFTQNTGLMSQNKASSQNARDENGKTRIFVCYTKTCKVHISWCTKTN